MAVINISKKSPSLRPFSNVSSGGLGGGGGACKIYEAY